MSDAVWVLDYLVEIVGSHQFSGEGKETNRSNFQCEIDRSVTLLSRKGNRYSIPTGSTLVVYRNPARKMNEQMTIACFHHCGGQAQTVVMGGGAMKTSDLGQKSVLGTRRFRRYTPPRLD